MYLQLSSTFGGCPSIQNLRTHHTMVTRGPPNIDQIAVSTTICCPEQSESKYTWMPSSIKIWPISLWVFTLENAQVNVQMLHCRDIVLVTVKCFDVAKFTALTPLSLLISCKLSFPIIDFNSCSLATLAMKSPNKVSVQYLGNTDAYHNYIEWVS
jgi:hypothetical protein